MAINIFNELQLQRASVENFINLQSRSNESHLNQVNDDNPQPEIQLYQTNSISLMESHPPPNVSCTRNTIKPFHKRLDRPNRRHHSDTTTISRNQHHIHYNVHTSAGTSLSHSPMFQLQIFRIDNSIPINEVKGLPSSQYTTSAAEPPGLWRDPPATRLIDDKRLIHQSIRLEHFDMFLPKPAPAPSSALVSLLATFGQLAPRNPMRVQVPDSPRYASPRQVPEPMLECAHCDALIPRADLSRHQPHSVAALTAELLAEVLAWQHLDQRPGRSAVQLLAEDDVSVAVAEGKLLPAKSLDSLSGVLLVYLYASFLCLNDQSGPGPFVHVQYSIFLKQVYSMYCTVCISLLIVISR